MPTTAHATLDCNDEVFVANVAPEKELLKTQNGQGTDKYRPTETLNVPMKEDDAFEDEFVDSPLWSSILTEKDELVPIESESTDLFTLGPDFSLDMALCEAMDQPSLDEEFFEQFVDLNGAVDDVAGLDFSQLFPTDICQPDMVTMTSTVQELYELASQSTHHSHDEITVIQTSDTVTSLPQSPDAISCGSDLANLHFDQAVDFMELFKALDSPALSTCDSTDIALPSVQEPAVVQPMVGKRKLCELPSPLQAKKVKKADSVVSDSDSSESIPSPAVGLHKYVERRQKNNVASRNARAARKERENNLFLQEQELEQSNADLRVQLEKLTKEAELLRKVVIEKLSRSNVA